MLNPEIMKRLQDEQVCIVHVYISYTILQR
jgi:hypothetical protein